jgi:hypothetical protein
MNKANGAIDLDEIAPKLPIYGERPDVFTSLDDYCIKDDEIGIPEVAQTVVITLGKPDGQTWARCNANPNRQRKVHCFKDRNKSKKLFVVPKSLLHLLGYQVH